MWLSLSLQAVISCGLIGAVDGQFLSYMTSVVTECLDIATPTETPGTAADPGGKPPHNENGPQSRPGTVSYTMPSCAACDCSTCTALSTYTTTFSVLCPTGLQDQPYTITETYLGMSSLPVFATPTAVPYGFTVAVETCTYCGAQPLTVIVTYPSGGSPFVPATTTTTTITEGNLDSPPIQTNAPAGAVTAPDATYGSSDPVRPTYIPGGSQIVPAKTAENDGESSPPQSTTFDTIITTAATNVPPDSERPTDLSDGSYGSSFATVKTDGSNQDSLQPQTKTPGITRTPAVTKVPPSSAKPTAGPYWNSTRMTPNTTIAGNVTFTFGTASGSRNSYSMSTLFSSYGSGQGWLPTATLTPAIYSDWAPSGNVPTAFLRVSWVLTATIVLSAALGALVDI
ncbi:hypothetical protein PG985_005138 [Apiospora marii]|uniref:Uncharacterized protein n=1 Tax=Apiospora marii TaxID=335849 RepID=A0ABR1SB66_9PEZI